MKTIHTNNTVEDYLFYVVLSQQEPDYEITAEFAVNDIKKTSNCGNDVSETLITLVKSDTDVWKPTLKFSYDLDVTVKERETNSS